MKIKGSVQLRRLGQVMRVNTVSPSTINVVLMCTCMACTITTPDGKRSTFGAADVLSAVSAALPAAAVPPIDTLEGSLDATTALFANVRAIGVEDTAEGTFGLIEVAARCQPYDRRPSVTEINAMPPCRAIPVDINISLGSVPPVKKPHLLTFVRRDDFNTGLYSWYVYQIKVLFDQQRVAGLVYRGARQLSLSAQIKSRDSDNFSVSLSADGNVDLREAVVDITRLSGINKILDDERKARATAKTTLAISRVTDAPDLATVVISEVSNFPAVNCDPPTATIGNVAMSIRRNGGTLIVDVDKKKHFAHLLVSTPAEPIVLSLTSVCFRNILSVDAQRVEADLSVPVSDSLPVFIAGAVALIHEWCSATLSAISGVMAQGRTDQVAPLLVDATAQCTSKADATRLGTVQQQVRGAEEREAAERAFAEERRVAERALAAAAAEIVDAVEISDPKRAWMLLSQDARLLARLSNDERFESAALGTAELLGKQATAGDKDATAQLACARELVRKVFGDRRWTEFVQSTASREGANDPLVASRITKAMKAGRCP